MNKVTTIYLVRHGESEGNAGNYEYDFIERGSPLTKKGREQAKRLAEKLKKVNIDVAYSSNLHRAHETAEIIVEKKQLKVHTSTSIRERSFYHYEIEVPGKTGEEIKEEMKKDMKNLDDSGKLNYKHGPKMESAGEGALRLLIFLKKVANENKGKKILVVAHGNIIRGFLTHIGFAPFDYLPEGSVSNTGFAKLETDGENFKVLEISGINIQPEGLRIF